MLAKLMESQIQDRLLALQLCWGRAQKRDSASAHTSVWEKAVSPLHFETRHFASSLYATGSFQAAMGAGAQRE